MPRNRGLTDLTSMLDHVRLSCGVVIMRFIAMMSVAIVLLGVGGLNAQEAGSGWLGTTLQDLTKEEGDAIGWDEPRGAKVEKLVPGSPAEAAGLLLDDVLISLDGVEIENVESLTAALGKKAAGTEIKLSVRRAGREKRLAVTLGARPARLAAAEPREDGPQLMLDTGGHMALIKDIAFTPDGRQLVSASDDKTIRVWDLETGKTLRIIRGEIAPGNAGKIFAMVLSPDGKWLAAGGWFPGTRKESFAVRLYDFSSGHLVALLRGHDNGVSSLAFSPDGRHLISGSGDNTAILWDVEARQLKHRLTAHRGPIYGVGFTPDGERVVTGSVDHELRLWRVSDGGEIAHMLGHGDKVSSLAVASDGTIASGDASGEIRLWDGKTGAFRKVLARLGMGASGLSISADGRLLLSGIINAPATCHVYDLVSGREIATYSGHDNSVTATAISPDGRWAATGGGDKKEIHFWDLRSGEPRLGPDGWPLSLAGQGQPVLAVGFSTDGRQIGWGNESADPGGVTPVNDRGPLQHAITLPSTGDALPQPRRLDRPSIQAGESPPQLQTSDKATTPAEGAFGRAAGTHGEWSLSRREGGQYDGFAILDIKKGEQVVASVERSHVDGYQHRSYSFSPDGETIFSGGDTGVLTAYDRAGKTLGEFIGHEGDVLAIAPSPDGRFLISGSTDQTVRLWNLKTRELLVTLFQSRDGEWVIWTPQGYYAASGPGADLIGWQIIHGPEHEAEYVTAAQVRKSLNRPDIVARAIQLASAEAAVKEAHGTNFKLADLLSKPVPRLRIVSPSADVSIRGGMAEVEIALDATPDPVKLIRIQVNGRQIAEQLPRQGGGFAPGTLKFAVPLSKGANTIRLAAVNETGETSADVAVVHEGEGELDQRGTLYLLAIGVDKYPNIPGSDLRYSGADAKAFAEAMEKRAGTMHERVVKRVLVNGAGSSDAPTAANILNALGILRQARDTDTVMVFVAGHGVNEGPNYRFLPTDSVRQAGGSFLPASVVPWYAFQEAIESAKGRRILFLDTCHAGNSYNQRLSNDSYQANIIVYSAARWDQLALERADLGHGLFTYATVEGIEGKAAKNDDAGRITTLSLRDFLAARVVEMAGKVGHAQEPQYFRGRDAENYVLAGRP